MAPRHFFSSGQKAAQVISRRREFAHQSSDTVGPLAQAAQPGVIARPLLTVAQVQALLGLRSEKAVYNLTYRPVAPLPVRRLGRGLRFDEAEVNAWTLRDRQLDPQVRRAMGQ